MTQTILITGGTGLVGTQLSKMLIERGFRIIILTRNPQKYTNTPQIQYTAWDVANQTIDLEALSAADFIIHLAGAGVVDKKWNSKYKKEILDSRTQSSKLIIEHLKGINHKVKAIVSSSAIGWYGPDKEKNYRFKETDPSDNSFLGVTCKLWEESIKPASSLGIRVCILRTGIVLSTKGGALKEFLKPIQFGIASILGNGKQIISWIHIEDLCRMFIHAIENEKLSGSYNAVAPMPVTNKNFSITLARILKGNFFIPMYVPSFILKLMMGESSIEVLKSTDVSCDKIKETGFVFYYPTLEAALKNLLPKVKN